MAAKVIQPVSLEQETRSALPTSEAAYHLNRAQQTLRLWACFEDGPLRWAQMLARALLTDQLGARGSLYLGLAMSGDYIIAVKSIGLSKVGGRKPCTRTRRAITATR
jgi:hypothetical protein